MDEPRALRTLVAVADDLSFSKAAVRLGTTQPTLSRAVRAFEDRHGVIVFDRTTRSVEITPVGAELLGRVRLALEELDAALAAAQALAAGGPVHVRLGFVIGAANGLLPRLARRVRHDDPAVDLVLEHLSVADQVVALRQRRIDVALFRLPADVATDRLVVHDLYDDPMQLALPDDHHLAAESVVETDLRAVRGEPVVFWPREMAPSLYDCVVSDWSRLAGSPPDIRLRTRDTMAILALVAAGSGISLVTGDTADALTRRGVTYRRLLVAPVTRVAVAHRPNATAPVLALVEHLRACAADRSQP